jgi:exodeoxyribonuclease VII large subunit
MKPEPISVSQLNKYIKNKVDQDEYLNNVLIKGEISNFKHHYTGHMYFTLKDNNSLIKCIMFKSYTPHLNFVPKDGMSVIVLGTVSVFERDGVYQIYCKAMQQEGIGDLYKEYEKLKAKLSEEGLFDESHKKKIPLYSKRIGVLTSETGSVIRDIINVSTRRNPNVYIKLLPVPVQGEGAGKKIADAINLMNEINLADIIIVARGGGSLEDLWPFNEEIVARAIYNSELPVISAVGHETDFSISDFVADLRAPTPSAAAELAVPDIDELKIKLNSYNNRYKVALKKQLEYKRLKYEKCMTRRVFKEPLQRINESYLHVDTQEKNIENKFKLKIMQKRSEFQNVVEKIDALSPLKTLSRGYSIMEKNGKIVKSKKELNIGDEVNIKLYEGTTKAKII